MTMISLRRTTDLPCQIFSVSIGIAAAIAVMIPSDNSTYTSFAALGLNWLWGLMMIACCIAEVSCLYFDKRGYLWDCTLVIGCLWLTATWVFIYEGKFAPLVLLSPIFAAFNLWTTWQEQKREA